MVWHLGYVDGAAPALASAPTTHSTGWSGVLSGSNPSARNSLRNILPVTGTGNRIRITYRAGTSGYYTVRNTSIGQWAGVDGFTLADPIEITFGGQSGFSIPANTEIASDWIEMTVPGWVVVINDNDENSVEAYGTGLGTSCNYFLGQSTYALQEPIAGSLFPIVTGLDAATHGVVKVEVGT